MEGAYGKYGVRCFRKRKNLSQSQVASELDMCTETYCMKERLGGFTVTEARKLASLFGMSLSDVGEVFFYGCLKGS